MSETPQTEGEKFVRNFGGFSFDDKPDFINEAGVKWWVDKSLNDWCRMRGLKGLRVFAVEEPNGHRTRLLCDDKGPLEADQTMEGMACRIDKYAIAGDYNENGTKA